MSWGRRAVSLSLPLSLALAALGCASPPREQGAARPVQVLLIGLDGASWNVMEPMLARGRLPHFARLVDEGVSAPLRTLSPSLSVVVWTSIATSKPPDEHGITDWDVVDPETGERLLASSASRKGEALWTMVSRAGRPVDWVAWWASWPAEPIRGHLVSDQFTRREKADLEHATYPEELAEELDREQPDDWPWLGEALADGRLRLLSDAPEGAKVASPIANPSDRLAQALFLYGQDYRAERAALHLLDRSRRPDLFGFLSRKIDVASHYMWRFLPPGARDTAAFSRILEPVYEYEDALVGRLIERAGPGVSVLLVSDHGFEREGEAYDHKEGAPEGIFIAWGPTVKKGVRLPAVSLYDVTPTVLHLLGLPVGQDMKGRVVEEALADPRPVRWVSTYDVGKRRARAVKSPLEKRLLEELRALGYVQ